VSADSWTHCPKCRAGIEAEGAAERKRIVDLLGSQYGKVDIDRYRELQAEAATAEAVVAARLWKFEGRDGQTFREDYEFHGAEDGEVCADYSGSCSTCGLSVSFQHRVKFFPEGDTDHG
jgi:hypothetical protein